MRVLATVGFSFAAGLFLTLLPWDGWQLYAAGALALEEGRGAHGAGIEMVGVDGESHSLELHAQLMGRFFGAVCQKNVLFIIGDHPVDEIRDTVQNAVAVIDNAVHIADEAGFL